MKTLTALCKMTYLTTCVVSVYLSAKLQPYEWYFWYRVVDAF